jgi:glucose-6-phosphate isomerase
MLEAAGVSLDLAGTGSFLATSQLEALAPRVAAAARGLAQGTCAGHEFLGWLDLPSRIDEASLAACATAAARAKADSQAVVVVGIGGSYLGARAVLDALPPEPGAGVPLLFAGTGLCSASLDRVLRTVEDRDFRVCVISKSGTTVEPAVAFRVLRGLLRRRYGDKGAAARITAVTDARKGALRQLADAEGWETFVVPDDVGGRFSVLTPVGLVPLAMAGVDVRGLVEGARAMQQACDNEGLFDNPAHLYAAARYQLYTQGFTTEVMSSFHSGLHNLQEWWKQLFGESEGKQGQGIFPASTVFTTDLHSLGQYLQDGRRNLQETFLCARRAVPGLVVPADPGADADGLGYLAGRSFDDINWIAFEATRQAHIQGGVPCQALAVDEVNPRTVGALLYMFEKAVGIGGLLLGLNPFDQPGVEAYKLEMFRRLGRPA